MHLFVKKRNFNFVISQCKINWFTWLYNSWSCCLVYKDSISKVCKLYIRNKHVTPSCLSLPSTAISATVSTVLCQHSDTAQCNIVWRSNMKHKKFCYFNVLLYLTSSILTECETQLSLTVGAISTLKSVTSLSSFILENVFDGGQFHVLAALFVGPVEKRLCELLFRSASFWQEKNPLSVLDI